MQLNLIQNTETYPTWPHEGLIYMALARSEIKAIKCYAIVEGDIKGSTHVIPTFHIH